jgi:hypothetical protein
MIPKTCHDPHSETLATFALASLSGALATLAVGTPSPALLLYPAYYTAGNAAIATLIVHRRHHLKRSSRRDLGSPGQRPSLTGANQMSARQGGNRLRYGAVAPKAGAVIRDADRASHERNHPATAGGVSQTNARWPPCGATTDSHRQAAACGAREP